MRSLRHKAPLGAAVIVFLAAVALAAPAAAQPTFAKVFAPDVIGVGSTSELMFTITNGGGTPISDLAFTDVLPAGVVFATPAAATTDCGAGMLSAPDGGGTLSLTGGTLAPFAACTVRVFVTSSSPGVYMNVSGDLTSNLGNSGPATDDLTVTVSRPGVTKSFSPATIQAGGLSTLTLTFDNSGDETGVSNFTITDNLPAGVSVATPLVAQTDCGGNLIVSAGATSFLLVVGSISGGGVCQIEVEVTSSTVGTAINRTSDMSSSKGNSGFAVAALEVEPPGFLSKSFVDDPVSPTGTVTLQFTLTNFDRSNAATGITFTDDLDAALSGLTAVGLPTNPCGAGSSLTGTNLLTFANGSLGAGASCTFSATLQVPAGAAGGSYLNTTSSVQVSYGGAPPVFENPATDLLHVTLAPILTKEFLDDPVSAGGSVTLRFTITNPTANAATSISFSDDLGVAIPSAGLNLPSPPVCNSGSLLAVPPGSGLPPTLLIFSGGSVAAMGSCFFDVVIDVPLDATPGDALNVTSDVTATVDGESWAGAGASDTVTVVAAPELAKSFDAAALPGGTVNLEFTLVNSENAPGTATAITFTDDLSAVIPGLTAVGLPMAACGGTLSGTTMLTFSGGSLAPDSSCSFSVPVQVPAAAAPGVFTNTTSDVAATMIGTPVASPAASSDLVVAALSLSKQFLVDTVLPGGTMTLRFTIANNSSVGSATNIFFTDSLTSALTGMTALGLPSMECNGGTLSGTTSLTFTGGSLGPSESCFFDVTVMVPLAAAAGGYLNTTGSLIADFEGEPASVPPAADAFEVIEPLSLLKEFIDDPVGPGATATLRFTLVNMALMDAATNVAFTDDLDASLPGLAAVGLPMAGCGGTLSGTTDLTFTGGTVAAASSCSFDVTVQVPAAASFGSYPNTTSTVTGMVGALAVAGAAASDTLTVSIGPAIEKSFLSSPVEVGGTTTLQFTITNTSPTLQATNVAFSDDLDAFIPGVLAEPPADGACGAGSTFVISPTQTLTMSGGTLAAGASCVFFVDLQLPAGGSPGTFTNTTSAVTATIAGMSEAGNAASADLLVMAPPVLTKTFLTNPVAAGGTTTLEFTIDNPNPDEGFSSIAFTDDLDAALSGLASVSPLQNDVCGTGSVLSGAGFLSFSGGSLAGGASCTFSVTVQVPSSLAANLAANVTSAPTASSAGLVLVGLAASDDLVVAAPPLLTKTFLTNPATAGGTTTLEFTIDNPNPSTALTAIAFSDDLDAALAGLASTSPVQNDVCGVGSQVSGAGVVSFTGGVLGGGASCTFSVTVQVPATLAANVAANVTGAPVASAGGFAVTGLAASDDLTLVAPPLLTKTFLDNPVPAGGTSTLEFTVENPNPSTALTAIAVSDDLDAALSGLASVSPLQNDVCGAGSQLSGGSVVSLTGGSLAAGASCTFSVVVQVPGALPLGTVAANVTGAPTATGSGLGVAGSPAADDLRIASFSFSKQFSGGVLPGDTVTLTFVLENVDLVNAATNLGFSDDLDAVLPGLAATDTPQSDVCGAGSTLTGTSVVTLAGGQLAPGASCMFSVTVLVPADAMFGFYTNTTTQLAEGGMPVADPAVAELEVLREFVIPTLDAWGLLLLVGLLPLVAWRRLRRWQPER